MSLKTLLLTLALLLSLATWTWSQVQLSEILPVNVGGLEDKDGDLSGWVEFYNPSAERVNLKGMYVTNDPDDLTKYLMPRLFIDAESYQILYLSGKDFNSLFNLEVHANFKVGAADSYFALVDADGVTVVDSFEDISHRTGASYGRWPAYVEEPYALFKTPTPRQENRDPILGVASDTKFSIDRGFYDAPIQVEITTETEGGRIIYTTDGRAPGEGNLFTGVIGQVYEGPITIDKTTVLRAAAFKEGFAPSNIDTQTYLFPEDVVQQDDLRTEITESEEFGPQMIESLTSIPSISLAVEELSRVTAGTASGNDVEYQTSVELLQPDGSKGFQVDAGVSRFGGYFTNFPKKSFRLYFRKRYGVAKLEYPLYRGHEMGIPAAEEFDALNLRSGSHDMNQRGAYLSNRFTDDTLLEMGNIAPHGRFVHLYFNGRYWGQYHLRERWNAAMFASYFGGVEEDYEAINGNNTGSEFLPGEPFDGSGEYWEETLNQGRSAMPYQALQNHIDFQSYLSFQLAWVSGNCESEFQSAGSSIHQVPFKFYFKDADGYLRDPGNRLSNRGPGDFFRNLRDEADPEFRMLLADTIHKHYFNNGAFTPERNIARLQRRVDETSKSFIAEAARWNFRTPDSWANYQQDLIEDHFPRLTERMVDRFEAAGWYPDTLAPKMNQFGGEIEPGFTLTLNVGTLFNPQPGDIFYTVDGGDPRMKGGELSETALAYQRVNGPGIALTETTTIKSRLRAENGAWSPLTEATFQVGKTPEPGDLVLSEIHYRPSAPSESEMAAGFTSRGDFEFLEIYNRSGVAVSLSEVVVASGVRVRFGSAGQKTLGSGGIALAVANQEAFALRYGEGVLVDAVFDSGKLSNDGENVRLALSDGRTLLTTTYNDAEPWPQEADGDGKSLTLRNPLEIPGDDDPAEWRVSGVDGGTPGMLETDEPGLDEDKDGDGLPAFAEEALGTSDNDASSGNDRVRVTLDDAGWAVTLTKSSQADVGLFVLETSVDLEVWSADVAELEETTPTTLRWVGIPLAGDSQRYVRLRISGVAP